MKLIKEPTKIPLPDNNKIIEEIVGRVNTDSRNISIARMTAKGGWSEPGQTPEFDEYTYVLKGTIKIETKNKNYKLKAGEMFIANKNEWIRYSTPHSEGAEYISVCIPAFSPDTVHRDE